MLCVCACVHSLDEKILLFRGPSNAANDFTLCVPVGVDLYHSTLWVWVWSMFMIIDAVYLYTDAVIDAV